MAVMAQARSVFRRFVWNRTTLMAIILTSPAILTAIGSFVMARWLDDRIAEMTQQRDRMTETARQLDGFTRDVERFQLDRASLLLVLTGQGSDMPLKFTLDRLFRLNAQGSMRRVAATLSSTDWATRMRPYEEIVAQDYDRPETVAKLQEIESGMIAEAGRRLTGLQEQINALATAIDAQTAWKTMIQSVGNSLMLVLTILTFFLKTNMN